MCFTSCIVEPVLFYVIAFRITCFPLHVPLLLTIISMKNIRNLDNTFVSLENILKVS